MWDRLVCLAPPTEYPLSLAEAKAHLLYGDGDRDVEIYALIAAAAAFLDGPSGIGVWLMTQTWRLTLDRFPPGPIDLPGAPIREVSAISYIDAAGATQIVPAEDYTLDAARTPARVSPAWGKAWPAARPVDGAVSVTFVAGYATAAEVSPLAVQAMKLLVGHWFVNREAISAGTARSTPLGVEALLAKIGHRF